MEMAKGSSSKLKDARPVPRMVSMEASELGAEEDAKSEVDSMIEEEEEEEDGSDSSAASDDLEGVAPRRRVEEESSAAGPSRNGGSRQLPRYAPPIGMMKLPLSTNFAASPFEWEAMASKPGMELWAIRVPVELKPTRLSHLNVSMSGAGPSGSLTYKHSSYTLRSAGLPKPTKADVDEEGRQPTAGPGIADAMTMDQDGGEKLKFEGGAEMIGGMRLMVPRVKEKGKLFAAPLEISRHLILVPETSLTTEPSTDTPLPSLLATSALDEALEGTNPHAPAKRPQPAHLLKFRNFAIGSRTLGPDVKPSAHMPDTAITASDNHVSEAAVEETPKKKRKSEIGEDSSVKKKKKVKV